jgi:hypothetical protein
MSHPCREKLAVDSSFTGDPYFPPHFVKEGKGGGNGFPQSFGSNPPPRSSPTSGEGE